MVQDGLLHKRPEHRPHSHRTVNVQREHVGRVARAAQHVGHELRRQVGRADVHLRLVHLAHGRLLAHVELVQHHRNEQRPPVPLVVHQQHLPVLETAELGVRLHVLGVIDPRVVAVVVLFVRQMPRAVLLEMQQEHDRFRAKARVHFELRVDDVRLMPLRVFLKTMPTSRFIRISSTPRHESNGNAYYYQLKQTNEFLLRVSAYNNHNIDNIIRK